MLMLDYDHQFYICPELSLVSSADTGFCIDI